MTKTKIMKSIIQVLLIVVIITSCTNSSKDSKTSFNSDQKAIEAIILNSYITGLQNDGDTIKIDKGFHPQFALLGKGDKGSIWALPIHEWRKRQNQKVMDGELPLKKNTKKFL